jgi:hypothetical protein
MKTIGYIDKCDGNKTVRGYVKKEERSLFQQKRGERIQEALKELKHLGNCHIVMIKGNKTRILFSRGF